MGSWTETCAISNLPVEGGSDVVLIYLIENAYRKHSRDASRGVYSKTFYAPASLPLFGTYADYGEIDIDPGPENDPGRLSISHITRCINWNEVRESMIDRWDSSFRDLDPEVDDPNESLWEIPSTEMNAQIDHAKFHSAAERGRIVTSGRGSRIFGHPSDSTIVKFTPIIILREVWDYAVAQPVSRWATEEERKLLPEHTYSVSLPVEENTCEGAEHLKEKRVREQAKDVVYKKLAALKEQGVENPYEELSEEEIATIRSSGLILSERENEINLVFCWLFSYGQDVSFFESLELIDLIIGSDSLDLERCSRSVCELVHVQRWMENNRKAWHPTIGSGSQSAKYGDSVAFYERMIEIAKLKEKEHSCDEYDFGEEDLEDEDEDFGR